MDLLLLSGESLYNRDWIELVEEALRPSFGQTKILFYDHWQTGQDHIDFNHEYTKLPDFVAGLEDYVVFAKSIGTVLAAAGIYNQVLRPKKCIFVGPAWLVAERNFPKAKMWFENYSLPTLFITKDTDPVASADQLRELLQRLHVRNYEFKKISGEDHKYEDLEMLKSEAGKFYGLKSYTDYNTVPETIISSDESGSEKK